MLHHTHKRTLIHFQLLLCSVFSFVMSNTDALSTLFDVLAQYESISNTNQPLHWQYTGPATYSTAQPLTTDVRYPRSIKGNVYVLWHRQTRQKDCHAQCKAFWIRYSHQSRTQRHSNPRLSPLTTLVESLRLVILYHQPR